jgi:hypothetical protein
MKIPFFAEMEKANRVLIAGAGGGFDIFCGLPLYFWLKHAGKEVHLANLSFSELPWCDGERPVPSLVRVTARTGGSSNYFPEVHLASWLSQKFGETPVYAIERSGVRPVVAAYQWMAQALGIDTVVLVDGGTDSLMCGDEAGLGTPQEDMASLVAAQSVSVARKFLVCLGFGIDAYHGVCHAHFLENAAALIREGGYLGNWSLLREMEEFVLYDEAFQFARARTSQEASIVNSSIIGAVNGHFGDHHASRRTEGSKLFINPFMGIYWAFQLDCVARRNLYLDHIKQTDDYGELSLAIEAFRSTVAKTRPWKDIPG